MDAAEAHVEKYLHTLAFTDVAHEPDGNVPPDVLVDGRIAVEVRRLLQYELTSGHPRALEETAIPLLQRFQRLLEELGPPTNGEPSWFVFLRFRRPVEKWKTLGPRLRSWLVNFQGAAQRTKHPARHGGRSRHRGTGYFT